MTGMPKASRYSAFPPIDIPDRTWPDRVTPSFIAFEGQGWADDLVARTLP